MTKTNKLRVAERLQSYAHQSLDDGQSIFDQAGADLLTLQKLIDEGEQSGEPIEVNINQFLEKTRAARLHG